MAVYLKEFENHTQYENYINGSGVKLPNVSICTTEGDVHYSPYVDPYVGHEYVEIGGLKWATMNVGANSVTDTGLYFQWGDISGYTAAQCGSGEGQKYFSWADYKYSTNVQEYTADMSKYNDTDHLVTLEASDDAVQVNWGGQWRMPTRAEYVALGNAVNTAWTADYQGSGVAGLVCSVKTDSSKVLFFPACGSCFIGSVRNVGIHCNYWSSSLRSSEFKNAYYVLFSEGGANWQYYDYRTGGYPVRGVVG